MSVCITKIIAFLKESGKDFSFIGSKEIEITGFSSLSNIKEKSIIWVKKGTEELAERINEIPGLLVVCTDDFYQKTNKEINTIICSTPKAVYFSILEHFFAVETEYKIEKSAVVETSDIGENCSVGHFAFIGPNVVLGNNVKVGSHVSISNEVRIGDNSIIGAGTVIGSEGFGYYKNEEGISVKVPHYGGVVIGRNVEIGANVCIDRGTLDNTVIDDFVKIDNLCHIAHNVHIGAKSKVIAMSMLAGSSSLGESVYVAPGTLVNNQVSVGDRSVVGLGAMVLKDVEEGKVVVGAPAKVLRNVTEEDMNL